MFEPKEGEIPSSTVVGERRKSEVEKATSAGFMGILLQHDLCTLWHT